MKNYIYLILIYFILAGAGYIFTIIFPGKLEFSELSLILTGALIISLITMIVFFIGMKKSEKKGVLYTMSAVGLKFSLFLSLFGIFALVKRDLSWHFILALCVIYLSFTLYLLFSFVRILKMNNQARLDDKGKESK